MNIYTSYFSNYKNIPQEFQCLSIANSKPKGLMVPTWKAVRPNWSTVKDLKNQKISQELFNQMYLQQLLQTYPYYDKQKMKELKSYLESFDLDIVLLCWEKEIDKCHRAILVKFLSYFFDTDWSFLGEL